MSGTTNTGFVPHPYQIEQAEIGYALLKQHGLCYNISEARTGKSLTSLLIVGMSTRNRCLIITKKTAMPDWKHLVDNYRISGKSFYVINYESVHRVPSGFVPDIAILDEAHHAISAYPNASKTMINVADVVWGLPLLYVSMTPHAESYSQLYHQLRLSPWSPFAEYTNFMDWHREYGVPAVRYLGTKSVPLYNETQEERIKPIFDTICFGITRAECGFQHEAEDVVHYVDLHPNTAELINNLKVNRMDVVAGVEIAIENAMSLFQKCYQIEGGTLKVQTGVRKTGQFKVEKGTRVPVLAPIYTFIDLGNLEKVEYIKNTFGDVPGLVIMYNYQLEEYLLKNHFKHALILQADKYAEGISLKEYDHLIIYSMSFRTSKYLQRRDRQNDLTRTEPIHVHYILVKGGISEDVYNSVVVKRENFNSRVYELKHGVLNKKWIKGKYREV